MTMTLIQTTALGANAASIVFSAIPNIYTDLYLMMKVKGSGTSGNDTLHMLINGANTSMAVLDIRGDGAGGVTSTAGVDILGRPADSQASSVNCYGNYSLYLTNYTAGFAKQFMCDGAGENNGAVNYNTYVNGAWNSSATITSLTFRISDGARNLIAGTSISLYGVSTTGATGATVA